MDPNGSGLSQGISAFLFIGLSGFLYLYASYYCRFRQVHQQPYIRTQLAFAYGLCVVLATSLIDALLIVHLVQVQRLFTDLWVKLNPFAGLSGVFGMAPVVAVAAGVVENVGRLVLLSDSPILKDRKHPFYTHSLRARMRMAALHRYSLSSEDELVKTLWRALSLGKLLQITLKSGKVYVGSPLASCDPSFDQKWLKIIPIASGFRDSETQSYCPTTDYRRLFEALSNAPASASALDSQLVELSVGNIEVAFDGQDLGILVPWSEISSATIYDPALETIFSPLAAEAE